MEFTSREELHEACGLPASLADVVDMQRRALCGIPVPVPRRSPRRGRQGMAWSHHAISCRKKASLSIPGCRVFHAFAGIFSARDYPDLILANPLKDGDAKPPV